jgi:hypothetical protein
VIQGTAFDAAAMLTIFNDKSPQHTLLTNTANQASCYSTFSFQYLPLFRNSEEPRSK